MASPAGERAAEIRLQKHLRRGREGARNGERRGREVRVLGGFERIEEDVFEEGRRERKRMAMWWGLRRREEAGEKATAIFSLLC